MAISGGSISGGRLSGGKVSGARRVPPPSRAGTLQYGGTAALAELAKANKRDTPLGFLRALGTPFEAALDYVSQPVYAVGNTIQGDWSNAAKNIGSTMVPGLQFTPLAGDRTLPSEALNEKGLMPNFLPLNLLVDVGLDPTTYISFGASAGVRTAARAAEEAARAAATRAAMAKAMSSATNVTERLAIRDAAAQAISGSLHGKKAPYLDRIDDALASAYDQTKVNAQAAAARKEAVQAYRDDLGNSVNTFRVQVPFRSLGALAGRNPALRDATLFSTDLPRIASFADKPVIGNVIRGAERMTVMSRPEVDAINAAATKNAMWRATTAGRKGFTANMGYDKGVHAAARIAGSANNRIDETASRAAAEWKQELLDRAHQNLGLKISPKELERVTYAITMEAELPRIAERLTRERYGNVGPALSGTVDLDSAYRYVQDLVKERYGVEMIDRAALRSEFSDEIDRMREWLAKIDNHEMAAGIQRGSIENYVPHYPMVLNRADNRHVMKKVRSQAKATGVNPLTMSQSMHERVFNDLAQSIENGHVPELSAPEIVSLRSRESGRLLTSLAGNDAIAAQYGVVLDTADRVVSAEARLAELQAREARAWERYQWLAQKRATPQERADAWFDYRRATSERAAAEKERPFRETPDSPMTSAPVPPKIQEAQDRVNDLTMVNAADDPAVVAAEALKDSRVQEAAREYVAARGLLQVGGMQKKLDELLRVQAETDTAHLYMQNPKYVAGGEDARTAIASTMNKAIDDFESVTGRIQKTLDNMAIPSGVSMEEFLGSDMAAAHAADIKRLEKLTGTLERVAARVTRFGDIKWDDVNSVLGVRADIQRQLQAIDDAEKVLADVAASTEKRMKRAETALARIVSRTERRNARTLGAAEQRLRTLRSTTADAAKVSDARKLEADLRRAYEDIVKQSEKYNGLPANFRAVGRQLQETADKIKRQERRLAAAEAAERKATRIDVTRVSKPEFEQYLQMGYQRLADQAHYEFVLVPPEIRAAAEANWQQVFGKLETPGALHGLTVFLSQATTMWKRLALMTPGYVIRNAMSDLMMMYVGGFRDVSTLKQAWGIHNKTGRVPGTDLTYEQIRLELDAQGLRQVGFSGAEGLRKLRKTGKSKFSPSKPGEGRYANVVSGMNESRENWVRAAMYLEARKAGMSISESRDRTLKWLFDYSDVAPAIAALRKWMVPFIVYPTKAIPALAEAMVRTPGFFANYAIFVENMNRSAGYPDLSQLPGPMGGSFALPSFLGGEPGNPIMFNPQATMPWGAANTFISTKGLGADGTESPWMGLQGLAMNTLGQMNPLFNAGARALNYSTYSGRATGDRSAAPWFLSMPSALGADIPYVTDKTDSYSGDTYKATPNLLNALIGLFPPASQTSTYIGSAVAGADVLPGVSPTGVGLDTNKARWDVLRKLIGINVGPYELGRDAFYAQKRNN